MRIFSDNKAKFDKFGWFAIGETARKIGISVSRLRYWERLGIVRPKILFRGDRGYRYYSCEDIHRAVIVKTLVENEKYSLKKAMEKLDEEKTL